MRIYLGFTVAGDRSSIEAARRILDVLQSLGHEVLTSHLVAENAWDIDRRLPAQAIFARDMAWLAQCDILVAEVSGSSFGVGFETAFVLGATSKRAILFFHREAERHISLLITGIPTPTARSYRMEVSTNFRPSFEITWGFNLEFRRAP
jgi:nucleoside 2-deoxyribosyltransferase